MTWEAVIGLEVHARLLTESKLFCGCSTAFGAPPNTQVCPVCLAYPGALPVLNRRAVELAMRMALATGCEIQPRSQFARKNYFYPDLPKGYQISQFERPLATGGRVVIGDQTVRLIRVHIEEDAGKLIHERSRSLVDLNRAGTPLIEIVSEPDVRSAADASAYFNRLRQILMYTEVCDGNMEEGSLRCDANVSLRRPGAPLGTRAEIKNLNSFRFLTHAIEFEIERQTKILESGGTIVQETRLFDPDKNETRSMRSKEEAHDYRYFPEPDLFLLDVDRAWIEKVRGAIPELPGDRSARYQRQFALSSVDAEILVVTRQLADYFEEVARLSGNPKSASNWIRNDVLRVGIDKIKPSPLAQLIRTIDRGEIGGKAAKEVFEDMASTGAAPEEIVERKGLAQVSDTAVIREAAERVISRNAAQVEQYRGGKTQVFGFLVGQLMKEMRGKANAEVANAVLRELLDTE
ncbi:MAG TPA: Asp-tRNA(Asn)/Glu-tRNA(Gln) amidotransferase subunit GatB [Thermoanaerobaculia bacterium]|nr:Asp-tRNA(Asn)/Glu-tRNA(Gln) amidotransferase subunit GatB [Thermoanaerobaculia bacterium]